MAERQFTGWHAAAVFGGAFGVIIAVNITLAVQAVGTFPGLEVKTPMSPARNSTAAATRRRRWAGPCRPVTARAG